VYVPTLALQILRNSGGSIPLKGIAVGNGVIGDAGQVCIAIASCWTARSAAFAVLCCVLFALVIRRLRLGAV
jgi:hypothetical protein